MNKVLLCLLGVLLTAPAGVFGQEEGTSPPTGTATVTYKVKLRREPRKGGLPYRFLTRGEQVSLLGMKGAWSKIETRWKFESGYPMTGFVPTTALKRDEKTRTPALTTLPTDSNGTPHPTVPLALTTPDPHTKTPATTWQVIGMAGPTSAYILTPGNGVRNMALGEVVTELRSHSAEATRLTAQLAEQNVSASRLSAEITALKKQRTQAMFTIPPWIMGDFLEARMGGFQVGLKTSDTKCIIRIRNQEWLTAPESLTSIVSEIWTDPKHTYLLVPSARVSITIGQSSTEVRAVTTDSSAHPQGETEK